MNADTIIAQEIPQARRRETHRSWRVILTLAAACAALTFAGCSSPLVWYQPGKSFAQTQRDLAICRGIASGACPPPVLPSSNTSVAIAQAGYGNQVDTAALDNEIAAQNCHNGLVSLYIVLAASSREQKILKGLMAERGYSLVDKNSLPPGVKGVPQ